MPLRKEAPPKVFFRPVFFTVRPCSVPSELLLPIRKRSPPVLVLVVYSSTSAKSIVDERNDRSRGKRYVVRSLQ
jgi:hypothetical protein